MEHYKISNSKHRTGAPPGGWGLRRRNLRVSGVGFQVTGKKNNKTETCNNVDQKKSPSGFYRLWG
jgi:hypothetical protein